MAEKEKAKVEVALKAEDKKLLHSVIDSVKGAHKHDAPPKPKEHWQAADLLKEAETCPTCKANVAAIGAGYLATMKTERAEKPLKCENCGTGVDESEEACPLCGGKDAKKG